MFLKSAWLIGLYTVDVDMRVEDLGYQLEAVFPTISHVHENTGPELIVLSDSPDDTYDEMEEISERFPNSLIISLPVNRFFLEEVVYSGERSAKRSVARLTAAIAERNHRWDN